MEIGNEMRESESIRLSSIRDYAYRTNFEKYFEATLNGSKISLSNNIKYLFSWTRCRISQFILSMFCILLLIFISCRTLKEDSSSYVISSLGKKSVLFLVRFTLGRESKSGDIDILISALRKLCYHKFVWKI